MNDDDVQGCAAQPIAHSAVGLVAACPGCGNVQLTLEYVTLRFQPAAFRELVGMLVLAQRRLESNPATRAGQAVEPQPAAPVGADEQVH